MRVDELATPALLVDVDVLDENIATMGRRWPGTSLRPHVKTFKATALARRLADAGHTAFCGATTGELAGLADAGLGDDLLLANETVDVDRLRALTARDDLRLTVAVDSDETVDAAARAGVREVLVDLAVGFRCGCRPDDAGRIARAARSRGLEVRGMMGYEAHAVLNPDRAARERLTTAAMDLVARAHEDVGGEVISAGGTGTWDINTVATELQAGSFLVMDTAYTALDLPFRQALSVIGTVISANDRAAVADAGVKALGMDHGDPTVDGAEVLSCSDEHLTLILDEGTGKMPVGHRVRVIPAHCDPTIAKHERIHLTRGDEVVDTWPVDLRHW